MALVASLVATVVSGVFATSLLRRWRSGSSALLSWGVSLAMLCVASPTLLAGVGRSAGLPR